MEVEAPTSNPGLHGGGVMGRSRHYATYGELFAQHLERVFARGGSAWEMARLAKLWEGEDAEGRQSEFKDWIEQASAFPCSRCGSVFSPDKAVEESHEVICRWCP